MMLTVYSFVLPVASPCTVGYFQKVVMAAAVMVMPLSFSCSIQSVVAPPSCTSPILWVRPVSYRIRSVVVVFPASSSLRDNSLEDNVIVVVLDGHGQRVTYPFTAIVGWAECTLINFLYSHSTDEDLVRLFYCKVPVQHTEYGSVLHQPSWESNFRCFRLIYPLIRNAQSDWFIL